MKLQKSTKAYDGCLAADTVYQVSATAPDGHVYYCAIYDAADWPDRKGVADGLWQARRALRAAILNQGFWVPGDECGWMAA